MVLILLLTTVCLIQLSNGKSTEWKRGQNIMTWLFIVWLLYYIMEIMNPNCVLEAWNINITPYALIPLICAFVVPVVIRTRKDIELLLLVWSVFVIIFTLKGYWQKNHGFSTKDLYFLHVLGGARTTVNAISYLYWADFVPTSSGRAYDTFPVFRTRQTTVCTQRWQPSPSPSPHSLSTPDGSVSISFL